MSRLHTLSLYPAARAIVSVQSEMQRFKTLGQKPIIHFQARYEGQQIMLLALYEKGALRPDVLRLLETARAEGLYILAVNTLKLKDPVALQDRVDCYIERPNFGRDFGSYKTGFLHIFKQGWNERCPRLLMINDSIFFSAARLPKFLNDMMSSDIEVLGATENYDIEYHLGSFCIAMSQSVLKHPLFQKYWRYYRITDVRPKVIKHGELKLSKVLKKCASKSENFTALYSSLRYSVLIRSSEEMINFSLRNIRTSTIFSWKRASLKNVAADYRGRYAIQEFDLSDSIKSLELSVNKYPSEKQITNISELKEYLREKLNANTVSDDEIHHLIISELVEGFMSGSQIHQNATLMLEMGLPIIKNDGLYRGIFSYEDVFRICTHLEKDEAIELQSVLMSRPYGGNHLTGWRNAAFKVGLL